VRNWKIRFALVAELGGGTSFGQPSNAASSELSTRRKAGAVAGALKQALPGRVMAEGSANIWGIQIAGKDMSHRPFTYVFFTSGGTGARSIKDGLSATAFPSGVLGTPVEVIETLSPLIVEKKALRDGSGGDGQYRGGLGQDVAIDIESDDDIAALFVVERTKIAAPGLGGGAAGGLGFVTINGKTIDNRRPQFVRRGDCILLGTPGGGGFGSANLRTTAGRERDQTMGYVEEALSR